MICRDFFCSKCGSVTEDVLVNNSSVTVHHLECDECTCKTKHCAVCNGGTKTRYRFADMPTDHRFWRDYVKCGKTEAYTVDDNGAEHRVPMRGGGFVGDQEIFSDDAREEKRARIHHKNDKKKGYNKIYLNAGGNG